MLDDYKNIDKLIDDVNEDEIIKDIMNDYPELYDQINYNEYNIKERLEKQPYLFQQWRLLYIKEKHKLNRIEILKDEYLGELYDKFKYEDDRKLTKVEIERYYIPKDKKTIKFVKLLMKQEIRVDVFETVMKTFQQQGYAMAQFIKNLDM